VNVDHRQLAEAVKSRADFVCADGCALPLQNATFDAVLAVECIFHFPSRLGFLQEACRILKPGGKVSLSDFVPINVDERDDLAREWLERQVGKTYGTFGGWPDGNYLKMAEKAGLVLERFEDVTTRTLPTYRYLIQRYAGQKRAKANPPPIYPTVLLAALSAARAVRYRTVVLRKP
jgi:SAM-dependent methyltransferase